MLNLRVLKHLVDPIDRATGHTPGALKRPQFEVLMRRGEKVFVGPWRRWVPGRLPRNEFGFETAN
jgi:hypothetical protein